MTNPLAIEQKFQTLKQLLKLVSSNRLRILRIMDFVEDLLATPAFFPAYAQELLPQLTKTIIETDFSGTNLNSLKRCIKIIERIENDFPNPSSDVLFKQAQHHLATESEKIQTYINSKTSDEVNLKSAHSKFKVDSVWIPMVEREQFLTAVNPLFASLQKLNIDAAFNNKDTAVDKLHIKQHSHNEGENELQNSLEAARFLLSKLAQIKTGKRVTINCSFNNPMYVEGQSLQAGLAAGLFTELLRLHQHKEEYSIQNDVAITGRVDNKANILPVDEAALKLKVEACYFSHIRYLVVPKEQEEICKDAIAKLNLVQEQSSNLPPKNGGLAQTDGYADQTQQAAILSNPEFGEGELNHPTSHISPLTAQNTSNIQCLEVVGISNLEELFYNRKFTDSRRITVARQTIRKVWKLRRSIAALLIISLLLVIGKMWYGPLDKNPVDYSADGEMLSLKNKYGEVVEKIKVGLPTIALFNHRLKYISNIDFVSFNDLDNDGLNEVIFSQMGQNGNSIVYCKSLKFNKYLWEFDVSRRLAFPNNEVSSVIFYVVHMVSGDFDRDGNPEIIILCLHNGLFPCLVFKLDARTGKELGNYLHIGSLNSFKICDIDNDGISEILLTGISNAFDIAVFTVLDTRFIYGHSPLTKNYVVEEYKPAAEKAYIGIPRTVVGNYYSLINRANSGKEIHVDKSKHVIRISLTDYQPPREPENSVDLSAFFGFDLKIQTFMTHDLYDLLSRKLYKEGKISRETNKEYFDQYKKEILYWDGDKFVNHFALNKRYLEAVGKLNKQ